MKHRGSSKATYRLCACCRVGHSLDDDTDFVWRSIANRFDGAKYAITSVYPENKRIGLRARLSEIFGDTIPHGIKNTIYLGNELRISHTCDRKIPVSHTPRTFQLYGIRSVNMSAPTYPDATVVNLLKVRVRQIKNTTWARQETGIAFFVK